MDIPGGLSSWIWNGSSTSFLSDLAECTSLSVTFVMLIVINSKCIPLSFVSHANKLIKPKGGSLQLAPKVGSSLEGLGPQPVGTTGSSRYTVSD